MGERMEVAIGALDHREIPLTPLLLLHFREHRLTHRVQRSKGAVSSAQDTPTAIIDTAVNQGGRVIEGGLELWADHVLLGEFVSLLCSRFKG